MLARASKAHWGYDVEFLRQVDPALVPEADYLAHFPVIVAERDGSPIGFYGFSRRDGTVFLEDMWLVPALIGTGLGRRLWEHAVATARTEGYASFAIESDPYAEGFYLRCGATRIGEIVSSATGRRLPLLRYDLPQCHAELVEA